MPLVTVTGNAWDHSGAVIPATLQPELWFVPDQSHASGNALLAGVETKATLSATTGAFTVDLWSDGDEGKIRYRPQMRHLTDPSMADWDIEKRVRGYVEWPFWVYPGAGGPIGDLIEVIVGVGLVWCSPTAPDLNVPYQMHFNTQTQWLYRRDITW